MRVLYSRHGEATRSLPHLERRVEPIGCNEAELGSTERAHGTGIETVAEVSQGVHDANHLDRPSVNQIDKARIGKEGGCSHFTT